MEYIYRGATPIAITIIAYIIKFIATSRDDQMASDMEGSLTTTSSPITLPHTSTPIDYHTTNIKQNTPNANDNQSWRDIIETIPSKDRLTIMIIPIIFIGFIIVLLFGPMGLVIGTGAIIKLFSNHQKKHGSSDGIIGRMTKEITTRMKQ